MRLFSNLSRVTAGRFFCAALLALIFVASFPLPAIAQFKFRQPPNRQDPSSLQEREWNFVWQQFLHNRNFGSFSLQGRLVYRPSREASQAFGFLLRGDWSGGREASSLILTHPDGRVSQAAIIVIAGQACRIDESGQPVPLGANELSAPLIHGLPFTWSDLLMPFIYWKDLAYQGPDRYLGRPAHQYALLNPDPEDFPARAVVTLDEDYAALLSAALYNSDGKLVKRIRVGGFKQFGGEWMFSTLYWENRSARSSVRLEVDAFSLNP